MRGGETEGSDGEAFVFFNDHDCSEYKPLPMTINMEYFDGKKDIRSLEVYTMRFVSGSEAMIEESRDLGQKFTECIEQQHVSYKAWTIPTDPIGREVYRNNGHPARSLSSSTGMSSSTSLRRWPRCTGNPCLLPPPEISARTRAPSCRVSEAFVTPTSSLAVRARYVHCQSFCGP